MKKVICAILVFSSVMAIPHLDKNTSEAKAEQKVAFVNDFRDVPKLLKTSYKWSGKTCMGPNVVTGKKSKDVSITKTKSFASTVSATIKTVISPGVTYTVGKNYSAPVTIAKYSKGCGAVKVKYKYQKYRVDTVDIATGKTFKTRYGTKRTTVKGSETYIPKYVYKNNKKKALKELK